VNPFIYPKEKHVRKERPGALSRYQKYKPFLQREFARKCIFCLMPDTMKDVELYGVEHYKPKVSFPHLITTYSNLFYACNPCNRRKGDYWPSRRQGKTHFVPNPCDHEMFKHLRFVGPRVEARSTAGETACELLDLNDPRAVDYRSFIIDAINTYSTKKQKLEETKLQLQVLRERRSDSVEELENAIASVESDLQTVNQNLKRLTGDS